MSNPSKKKGELTGWQEFCFSYDRYFLQKQSLFGKIPPSFSRTIPQRTPRYGLKLRNSPFLTTPVRLFALFQN